MENNIEKLLKMNFYLKLISLSCPDVLAIILTSNLSIRNRKINAFKHVIR